MGALHDGWRLLGELVESEIVMVMNYFVEFTSLMNSIDLPNETCLRNEFNLQKDHNQQVCSECPNTAHIE